MLSCQREGFAPPGGIPLIVISEERRREGILYYYFHSAAVPPRVGMVAGIFLGKGELTGG